MSELQGTSATSVPPVAPPLHPDGDIELSDKVQVAISGVDEKEQFEKEESVDLTPRPRYDGEKLRIEVAQKKADLLNNIEVCFCELGEHFSSIYDMVHAFAQQRFNEIEGDFEEDMYKIRGMESDQEELRSQIVNFSRVINDSFASIFPPEK